MKAVLFGGHSVGVTNAKKALEWQNVADNVNDVASEGWSVVRHKSGRKNVPGVTQAERLCHR